MAKQTDYRDEITRAGQQVGQAETDAKAAKSEAVAAKARADLAGAMADTAMADAALAKATALAASRVELGTKSITFNTVLSVALAVRDHVITGVTDAKVGDRVTIFPVGALPSGYAVFPTTSVITAGQVPVKIAFPAIAAISSVTLTFRMIAYRD